MAMLVSGEDVFIEINTSASVCAELLGERFRRDTQSFVDDLELRAYHKEGSQQVILAAARAALQKLDEAGVINKVILPVKDGRSALMLAKKLGFDEQHVWGTKVFSKVGDTGACMVFMELAGCLAEIGEGNILMVSYGSGACSDAVILKVKKVPDIMAGFINDLESSKVYIDYLTYLKKLRLIGVN
ncbi:hypothetical protein G7K71_17715 [Desulfofundulus sp. TPOSR]|uniref:hypothetical protein n=1 Tax=Desulfofundulus sp. TPOSR TaxID=2714340 RepID=UPI0014092E05|nr:hypothetical protein [Desulfofundulus sp. TPOSR]NHM28767.1 hypothetical protein [Desulfofundulus sp. TPOSR]